MERLSVLFVVDQITFLEVLSIPTLSAALKHAGHKVQLVEFGSGESKVLRQIEADPPDVLAYSICSTEVDLYLSINNRLKSRTGAFSVFGGPHSTFFPDFVHQQGVDAICRG